MTLDELIDFELDNLDHKSTEWMNTVQETLKEIRQGERTVLRLKAVDRYRLLTLKIWSERYRVPLKYILQVLMAWTETFARKHFQRAKNTEGFGVKVSTLCGKRSQEILEDQIRRDFPNSEHKTTFIQREQNRILEWEVRRQDRQDDDGIKTPDQIRKNLFDFPHPKGYVRYYRNRIRRESRQRERIIQELEKRLYRGNPFREETI